MTRTAPTTPTPPHAAAGTDAPTSADAALASAGASAAAVPVAASPPTSAVVPSTSGAPASTGTTSAAAPAAAPLTYVVGHRNPDADCVCAAIAYAAFKEARGEPGCVAARCGNSNDRIDTILRRFHTPLPLHLGDVTPRVRDIMVRDVVSAPLTATCAEALALIDEHDVRVLPVTDGGRHVLGTLSIFQLGGHFVPRVREPREMRKVETSLAHIARALHARVLHVVEPDRRETLYVRVGAMDIRSFGKFAETAGVPESQTLIIVGDRWDIQQRSIQIGVRAVVVTGDLPVDEEVIGQARQAGVSFIVSPYDSATTAWVIRTASTIDRLIDRRFASVGPDVPLSEFRRRVATSNAAAHLVLNDEGLLQGIVTKTDVLKPVKTRLVLVDHNEMSQAVPGAHEVTIAEVIDHHRLGALNTQQPILFINEPVGSTCTIVADLFRRENLLPTPDIAGLMMSGIIADTLHLNSPTTTAKDAALLRWLGGIAGVDARELAGAIFNSGSVILANPPASVLRSDFKLYQEDGVRFSVSQVEELGFGNFWKHAKPLSDALQKLRADERLAFACLLVTDINSQNSLLLAHGETNFIERISYPHVEKDEIFDLRGIVSRKKQLIPYLTSLLKEMQTAGELPRDDG
ncbi:MAG: putative manganese-dependent inorganic diphosphatase [Opitutaceae bacterium]|jgi:manganese-dependent inorganic pyrophosphatase|nr:putative manganese-dependent inorganic diphosphatase [Opitutaceae bacterium]